MKNSKFDGAWGEKVAARHLLKNGYKILAKNYSCRFGEVDIIAQKGEYLVFAEVKTRKDGSHGLPREFVTAAKQKRLLRTAEQYLMEHESDLQPRFDVLEVYPPCGYFAKATVHHLENAFL